MKTLLQLNNLGIQIAAKQLVRGLSLTVPERARIGIVGPNGSGKSTILRVMAGELEPDEGRVLITPGIRIGYVPQVEHFTPGETVLEAVVRRMPGHMDLPEVEAAKALSRTGFDNFSRVADELSGGWRKRLSLAAALAAKPDLLLLDEPTNHLDFTGLRWLEELLRDASFAWLLISHDRYFLNQTVQQIVEISSVHPDGHFHSSGNYLKFKEHRDQFLLQEAQRTSALANKARRELEWASRSPKARTGKASFRMKEAERLQAELKVARSRKERPQAINLFQAGERNSKELVQLIKCSFAFPNQEIFKGLTFTLTGKTCLGLLGANGQGKSTLLQVIGGALTPTTGKVKHIPGLQIVYFDQLRQSLDNYNKLGELLGEGHEQVIYQGKPVHIIGWAKRFGFEVADFNKPVGSLSGGEQARALLSLLVRKEADLLLLDEPTNDLDIHMREALETMILEFPGAVVLITHDRYMLDEVCSHFLGFSGEGTLLEYASFEQWNSPKAEQVSPSKDKKVRVKQKPTKLSYKDQLEYDGIEERIFAAEERLEQAETRAADPALHSSAEGSAALAEELSEAKQDVEKLYARWAELDSLKRQIEDGNNS